MRRIVSALLLMAAAASSHAAATADQGQALFEGRAPLLARIAGQDFALPTDASRCTNCHRPAPTVPRTDTQRFGPLLTAALLTEPQRRRGGPPSRYDAMSLCKLLRTGIDPAHVMVARTMPRYEIGDDQCHALWAYLTRQGAQP